MVREWLLPSFEAGVVFLRHLNDISRGWEKLNIRKIFCLWNYLWFGFICKTKDLLKYFLHWVIIVYLIEANKSLWVYNRYEVWILFQVATEQCWRFKIIKVKQKINLSCESQTAIISLRLAGKLIFVQSSNVKIEIQSLWNNFNSRENFQN